MAKKSVKKKSSQEWVEKKVSLGNAIIIGAVLAAFGVVVGINFNNWFGGFAQFFGANKTNEINQNSLQEVYNKLAESYNGEVDEAKLIEGAKKGMVEALGDPYTVYMDAEETVSYTDTLHGNIGAGIGVELGLRDGYVRVLRVLPDNPALRAGIMIGDIFYKINGEEVYKMSTAEITKRLRGEAGTELTVVMARNGKEVEFKMKREKINNVSAYINYDGNTAIITVTRFDNDTGTKIQNMVSSEFKGKDIKKVILDLRGNGGGYVAAAQDLLSLWLEREQILTQKSLHFGEEKSFTSGGKAVLKNMKTIVLVNGSTASASEITAAALKEYGKATIVGTKTYGKGVVQKMINLSGGTMLKVTVAEWLTPKGNSINDEGVTPDVEVGITAEDINKMRDPQLDKAKSL